MTTQTTTTAQEVKERMAALLEKRAAQLAEIDSRLTAARAQAEAAAAALEAAQEETDLNAYRAAKEQQAEAAAAIEMLTGRAQQLRAARMVTEAESDAAIDSLLKYEDREAYAFSAAIIGPLEELSRLLKAYKASIAEAEAIMQKWQAKIHPNYRSSGTVYPDGTHRAPTPQPVRRVPFFGCPAAIKLDRFLAEIEADIAASKPTE